MIATAVRLFIWMSFLTGFAYPLLITIIAQTTMPVTANGSFITHHEKTVGSKLIGQKFTSNKYFWGRPSATDYSALPSGGSNLGPTSAALKKAVEERKAQLLTAHNITDPTLIPVELLFSSGSGLDPHISPAAAHFQVDRIVKARGLDENGAKTIREAIEKLTIHRTLGFLGEPHINVLELNLSLPQDTHE